MEVTDTGKVKTMTLKITALSIARVAMLIYDTWTKIDENGLIYTVLKYPRKR